MSLAMRPLNVAILAVPEVTASALFGMLDLFASAGRDWSFLLSGVAGEQRMRPYVVAATPAGFTAAMASGCCRIADWPTPPRPISSVFRISSLSPASTCSGAVLLAEAGLLEGCEATIHWAYVASLTRYPGVRVHAERSLVVTGAGGRIVMGGGGTSWQDMALYLIARHVGLKEARQVARTYLIDWHDGGQLPFASLLVAKQVDDALIARCQEWAAMNYSAATTVATMMRISGLPERSFMRRFSKATGLSPLEYVHRLRIEEAKQMLETGDAPIEAIAVEVGYQDASFFGRLFRRRVGLTPARYRRRFGSLRLALEK